MHCLTAESILVQENSERQVVLEEAGGNPSTYFNLPKLLGLKEIDYPLVKTTCEINLSEPLQDHTTTLQ